MRLYLSAREHSAPRFFSLSERLGNFGLEPPLKQRDFPDYQRGFDCWVNGSLLQSEWRNRWRRGEPRPELFVLHFVSKFRLGGFRSELVVVSHL